MRSRIMNDEFKLWSESSSDAKRNLKPSLSLRAFNDLSSEEKEMRKMPDLF